MLALRDCREEWPSALCMLLSITAVLVPIMLLLSIRAGVIGQLQGELAQSPQARELVTVGEPSIDSALVDKLRASDNVAFVAPRTRLLSAGALLRSMDLARGIELDMIPSGPGDPLVHAKWRPGTVALSESAARGLDTQLGQKVLLVIDRRTTEGADEQARIPLTVIAIVDNRVSRNNLSLAYLPARLVSAAERWREDPTMRDIDKAGDAANAPRVAHKFSGLRLFARTIDDVDNLRRELQEKGIETESRAGDIRLVQRLKTSMNIFIGSLAALMSGGLVLALGAIQWGWVERKRYDYSYLRLLGMEPRELGALPVVQAMMMVIPGGMLALVITLLAQLVINRLFAGQLGALRDISRIDLTDTLLLMIGTFLITACGAFFAARSAARISPIVALRGN